MSRLASLTKVSESIDAGSFERRELIFDRASGAITDANSLEVGVIRLIQLMGRVSAFWSFRGFGLICRGLQKLFPRRTMTVRLNNDARFSFPFADKYWSILLDRTFQYEDDIEVLFRASRDLQYTLVDCGANFGYWSVLLSSKPFGTKRVIAIEPASHGFAMLTNNAAINRTGFACRKCAVGGAAGVARLTGTKHESMTIAGPPGGDGEEVRVIALDSLLDDGTLTPSTRVILKLDVEAQEIAALSGAKRLLAGDCAVICEDHGNDRNHAVSRHLLSIPGMKLFCYDPEHGGYVELRDVTPLDRIKRFRSRGYNVIATASLFWEKRLRTTSAASHPSHSRT